MCVCLCVAAVPWNLRSVYALLLQTQWLFVPNITLHGADQRLENASHRLLLIYRFKSQTRRGCTPLETQNHPSQDRQIVRGIVRPLPTHKIGFTRSTPLFDNCLLQESKIHSCFFVEINIPPQRDKTNLYDRLHFCPSQKTSQGYLLPAWA